MVAALPDAGPGEASDAGDDAGLTGVDDAGGPRACPAGMILVDTTDCTEVRRRCKKDELNKPNHITICHEFGAGHGVRGEGAQAALLHRRVRVPEREGRAPAGDGELVRRRRGLRRAGQAPLLGERVGERLRGAREAAFSLRVEARRHDVQHRQRLRQAALQRVYSKTAQEQNAELLGLY